MTPPSPFLRAALFGVLALAPGLALGQTAPTTPPAPTIPMAQPAMPGAAPAPAFTGAAPSLAARPAMPSRATNDQRTSKIVGADVFNEAGTSVGSVDDLILGSGGAGMTAVLSVGGFLGIGARLVTVPMSELRYNQQTSRWMLPGATRETLTARPAFSYEPRG